MKILLILAVLALLKVTLLYRVYHLLPVKELKRRARSRDVHSAALYKVAANQRNLDVLLYIFGIAAATFILVVAARYAWWAALLATTTISWLLFLSPNPRAGGLLWRLCAATSPYTFKVLSWLYPATNLLAKIFPVQGSVNSGAYETEDLIELIKNQEHQHDNRIPKRNLDIAVAAIEFSDKKVAKVMTPLKKIKFVKEDEVLGPMMIDELHKSGRVSFPVVKGSTKTSAPNVTGVLFLSDIIEVGQQDKGTVRDVMKPGAYFINEECDLNQALDAIFKKQHHQLIVVNNFEETVGVIAFEDILRQLIGERMSEEFEHYEDPHAVAGIDSTKHRPQPDDEQPEPGQPEESADKTTIASEAE